MEAPLSAGDHFIVEDLLDFSNEDAVITDGTFESSFVADHSTGSSPLTAVDSCNSPLFSACEPNLGTDICCGSFVDGQFAGELCVPYDDLAELEWVSNFVEESFSCEDLQKLQLISGLNTRPEKSSETGVTQAVDSNQIDDDNDNPTFNPDMAVPAKARSKRSRAAPGKWASRLLALSPNDTCHVQQPPPSKPIKTTSLKKKDGGEGGGLAANPDGRRCLHCATDKTPQWRTGPMGPKTLCNACGVRYKSGRLVPEYRPAASPTFVLTKHSNSHRKVLELRRQKETLIRAQQQHHHQPFIGHHHHHHQDMIFDASNGDDYLIHQYVGPDFR